MDAAEAQKGDLGRGGAIDILDQPERLDEDHIGVLRQHGVGEDGEVRQRQVGDGHVSLIGRVGGGIEDEARAVRRDLHHAQLVAAVPLSHGGGHIEDVRQGSLAAPLLRAVEDEARTGRGQGGAEAGRAR